MKITKRAVANNHRALLKMSISQLFISLYLSCCLSLLLFSYAIASDPDPELNLTQEEISWLVANKDNISYGPNPHWPPGDYMENGEHKGIVSDYIKIFEKKLGITFKRVYYDDWLSFYDGLMTGEFDFVGAFQETEERKKVLVFTEPFLTTRLAVLTRTGSPALSSLNDLNSMTLAAVRGYSSLDYVKSKYPKVKIVECDDDLSVLLKLSAGVVDCAVVDYMLASYMVDKYSITNINYALELDYHWDLRFAVNKNKYQLRQILDKVLGNITYEERNRIYHKWVSIRLAQSSNFIERNIKLIIGLFSIILFSLIVSILFNKYLKKQVAVRTKELQKSSEKLSESLDLFQTVFEAANVGKSITSPSGDINVNRAFAEMLGYQLEELRGKNWRDLTLPEDIAVTERHIAPLMKGTGDTTRFEKRYSHKDGRVVWVDISMTVVRDHHNRPRHFITTNIDISERKHAEETLRHYEMLLRDMERIAHVGGWEFNPDNGEGRWTDEVARIYDLDPTTKMSMETELNLYQGSSRLRLEQAMHEAIELGKSYDLELELVSAKGVRKWIRTIGNPSVKNGKVVDVRGSFQDITDFKRTEKELIEAYDIISRSPSVAFTWKNEKGWPVEFVSENVQRMLGYPVSDFITGKVSYFNCIHIEDRARVEEELIRTSSHDELNEFIHKPYRILTRDGEEKFVRDWTFIVRDDHGLITHYKGIVEDISEQLNLESQLRQAQKMEAIGRLAGGVAHDYNNILSVIIGYTEMALEKVDEKDHLKRDLSQIYDAAIRSKGITRQLLAFARKETAVPEVLDLNATVENMLKILKKIIGENVDLSWHPGNAAGSVLMDPSQLDQILANLCVNARDAISDVGKIIIETNATDIDEEYCAAHPDFFPGKFVLLIVSDNGCGMDRKILENVFEPFFTTKGSGEGTGLGLSTVYGIVKQNNGFIHVYSEPGHGTTFKIYLPKHFGGATRMQMTPLDQKVDGSGKIVLVVEDDRAIAELVEQILTRHNFKVLLAQSPTEALRLSQKYSKEISLLLTDVIMPEMNGLELSEKVKKLCPQIVCVYMSGYTSNVIVHHGVLDEGIWFIQKPFSNRELLAKVNNALTDQG